MPKNVQKKMVNTANILLVPYVLSYFIIETLLSDVDLYPWIFNMELSLDENTSNLNYICFLFGVGVGLGGLFKKYFPVKRDTPVENTKY